MLTLCDILPPVFRLPNEDPNYVITPILDAFCSIDVEILQPAIADVSRITSIEFTRAIDILLINLGNPFPFIEMTEIQKRRLARSLIPIYRLKGTAKGIEQAILFFLRLVVNIVDFAQQSEELWVLAESELGQTTVLSPGIESPDLFTFLVEFDECITENERDQAEKIIDFIKPGWTKYFIIDCINPEIRTLPLVEGFEHPSWL